jgi:hypothetical protein
MRKFIITILRFSLVFLVVSAITVSFLTKIVERVEFPDSDMYYSDEFDYAFKEKNIELLALGNSKLLSALDKSTLEDELNMKCAILGYSSANISISKLTLESYLNKCIEKPKMILLEVSWFTFNDSRTGFHKIGQELLLRDLHLWVNVFKYQPSITHNLGYIIIQEMFGLLNFQRNEIRKNYGLRFKECSPISKDYEFDLVSFSKVFPDSVAGINDLLIKDYESIINLCNKYDIELVLFTTPEDESYSRLQLDRMEIKRIFQKTKRENQNVVYLDYAPFGDLWNKNHEMWLGDSHHLNCKQLFTNVLTKDIKLMIRKRPS